MDDSCSDLEAAVAAEDYSSAANIKSKIQDYVTEDPVAQIRVQMQQALAAEDYVTVARLRNEGWAWLEGWWASEDGQLMRIAPE